MKGIHLRIFHEVDPRPIPALLFLKEEQGIINDIEHVVFDPKTLIYKAFENLSLNYAIKKHYIITSINVIS